MWSRETYAPQQSVKMNTFLSHTFTFQAALVTGNAITEESSLLFYTARLQDDGAVVEIKNRYLKFI